MSDGSDHGDQGQDLRQVIEVEATVRGEMHTEIDNDKMPMIMMDLQKDSKVEATVRGEMHTEIDNDKMPMIMMDIQKDSKEVTKNSDNTVMKPISTKESEVMGCWIPDYTPEVVQYVKAQGSATETVMNQIENIGKGKKSTPCKQIKKAQEKLPEEEDLDNMSEGDNEQAEFNQTDMDEWE
jgi:hypothetical protein